MRRGQCSGNDFTISMAPSRGGSSSSFSNFPYAKRGCSKRFKTSNCATRRLSDAFCRALSTSSRLPSKRSEEHTSELQSHVNLVCRLLLEKKKKNTFLHP